MTCVMIYYNVDLWPWPWWEMRPHISAMHTQRKNILPICLPIVTIEHIRESPSAVMLWGKVHGMFAATCSWFTPKRGLDLGKWAKYNSGIHEKNCLSKQFYFRWNHNSTGGDLYGKYTRLTFIICRQANTPGRSTCSRVTDYFHFYFLDGIQV